MNEFIQNWILHPTTLKIAVILAALILIRFLAYIINQALASRIHNRRMRHQARKATGFFGYLMFLLLVGIVFSSELSGLTVALGVATAGIAFALQEVITSFAGWLAILAGQFYDTGDRVQLGGIIGDVIDIGILRTTLMECGGWVKADLYNGRTVRVANSFVFREPVYNYSAGFPFLWDEFTLPIKYGSDHNMAHQIMEEAANAVVGDYVEFAQKTWARMQEQYLVEDTETRPMITILCNDNWVEFTIRYVVEYKKRRSTKDKMARLILDEINKTQGRVALASATLHIVETPPFRVQLHDDTAR